MFFSTVSLELKFLLNCHFFFKGNNENKLPRKIELKKIPAKYNYQKQCSSAFYKKGVLESFAKFNFIKKETPT